MNQGFHLWLAWCGGAVLLLAELLALWRQHRLAERTHAHGGPNEP